MTELKSNIIQNATELFAKKGCRAITMDDISKSLGMSKRTIYENFKDKEELLTCCIDLLFKEVDIELDSWENSSNIILSFLEFKDSTNTILHRLPQDFFMDVKRYFPNVYDQTVTPRINEDQKRTIHFLEKGQKEGYFLQSINNKIITTLIQEVGRVISNEEFFSPKDFKPEEIFQNGFIPFLRGLSTQKGIDTIDKYYNLH